MCHKKTQAEIDHDVVFFLGGNMEISEILELLNELSGPVMSIIAIIIAFIRTRKTKTKEQILAKQVKKTEKAKIKFEKELSNYNKLNGGEESEISNN